MKAVTHVNGNPIAGAVYYVRGTQTEDTGSWTGDLPIASLYDGLTIIYYLPKLGSGNATLDLTLSNGNKTGPLPVYLNQDSRLTTHFNKGASITLVYRSSRVNTSGTEITNSWVHLADYDTSNNTQIRDPNNIKAANAITAGTIIVGTANGYKTVESGVTFDLQYPILYANATIANGSTGTNNFKIMPDVNLRTTKNGWEGVEHSEVFLVATLSGNTATVDESIFSVTPPSSADEKIYIPIGILTNNKHYVFFCPSGQVFAYRNGHFGPLEPDLSNFAAASSAVTKVSSSTDNAVVRFDGTDGAIQNSTVTIDDNGNLSASRILLGASSEGYSNAPLRIGLSRLGEVASSRILNITGKNGIYLGVSDSLTYLGYSFTSSYISAMSDATVGRVYTSGNETVLNQFKAMYAKDFVENGDKLSDIYAKLASPAFTGTPTAPTASAGTNSTQLATTEFVANAIGALNLSATYAPITGNGYVPYANANSDVTGIRNLTISGNLTVSGTTTTVESTTLEVADALITVAKGNTAALTQFAGIVVPKYDGTNSGALVFDSTGTAYVGDATVTSSGTITSQEDMMPLATRAAADTFTDSHIVVWDEDTLSIKDGGKTIAEALDGYLTSAVTSISAGTGLTTNITNNGAITGTGTISLSDSGVTNGSYGPENGTTLAYGGKFKVPYITVDSKGRVTGLADKEFTLPSSDNTDTKVNVTLGTTTKAYLLATSTKPTSTAQAVTAIADTGVYLDTASGSLVASSIAATSISVNGSSLDDLYYSKTSGEDLETNAGNVTGSTLTKGYFVVGNDGAAIKISSMKPTTSSTDWDSTSDVNVPTMKSIHNYANGAYAPKNSELTTFSWANGTTAGPTGLLTNGKAATASDYKSVSFGAIPSASVSNSGIVTTGAQTIAGAKTFSGSQITIGGTTNPFLALEKWTGNASTAYRAVFQINGSDIYIGLANSVALSSGVYSWGSSTTNGMSLNTSGDLTVRGKIIKDGGTSSQILLANGGILQKADWVEYIDLTSSS